MNGSLAQRLALNTAVAAVFFFLLAPLCIVFAISFSSAKFLQFPPPGWSLRWYELYLGDRQWMAATWLSVRVGIYVAIASTFFGSMLAYSVVRGRYRGRDIVEKVGFGPLIVPHIIIALAVYWLYSKLGLLGTEFGLVIAHTILAIPVVLVIVGASLRTFDASLELAAMSLGANRVQAIWMVTVPQLRPALLSAMLLAFLTSFDEVVLALFISGRSVTLPKLMFDNIVFEVDPRIAAVSVLQIVLVFIVLAVSNRLGSKVIAT